MSWYRNLGRREFIQIAVAAAAASGTLSCSSARNPWRFLRVSEARTLAAICDQLIPPDTDPGADWARVVNFIDVQLCGPYRDLRTAYRRGIASIDSMSIRQGGKIFAEVTGDQQVAILTALEKGQTPKDIWNGVDPSHFFETVLSHTMQGYYGDPRHGGNWGHASWKMLGLDYPQVRGRMHYDSSKT